MFKLTYKITTLSSILIATNVGDINMVATSEYITGSAVMGVFASKYIQKNSLDNDAQKDNTFYQWFLKGDLTFTNAYIVSHDEDERIKKYLPVPLSLQHEKGNEKDVYDLLYADEDFDKQTSIIGGFGRIEGKNLYKQDVKKSLNFHHQRNPETGTSKEGMIFNYESINAGQNFEGFILGGKEILTEFIRFFGNEQTVYIGRSRNAQYGKVKIEIISKEPEGFVSEIEDLKVGSGEVSLTLLSNTILYNKDGFFTTNIQELENTLGNGIKLKKAFIKTGDVENFISVWKLRRPSETCFLAGSCFLLEVGEGDKDRLLELQRNGIGERRGEGFGRIIFGWQAEENSLTKRDSAQKRVEKPNYNIPPNTKEIVTTVVKDFIRKQVELTALNEAKDFLPQKQTAGLLSKSLIGRLEAMSCSLTNADFCEALDKLRKTAKDKLQNCKNSSRTATLFDFIKNKKVTTEAAFAQTSGSSVKKLCNEIGLHPESDGNFEAELYHTYFLTFFSAMRKALKKGEN